MDDTELSSETVSNNFKTHTDDIESSFVILSRNVVGSSPKVMSDDEESPHTDFNNQQFSSNTNLIRSIEDQLQEMFEENLKLKNTLEESDSILKHQFKKIEKWQNEVMSVCQNHNEKYIKTKSLIDMMRAGNEHLRSLIQNPEKPKYFEHSRSDSDSNKTSILHICTDRGNELNNVLKENKDPIEHCQKSDYKDCASFSNDVIVSNMQDQLEKGVDSESSIVLHKLESIPVKSNFIKLTNSNIATNSECDYTCKQIRERVSSLDNSMTVISLSSTGTAQTSTKESESTFFDSRMQENNFFHDTIQKQYQNSVNVNNMIGVNLEEKKLNLAASTDSSIVSDKESIDSSFEASATFFQAQKVEPLFDNSKTSISLKTAKKIQTPAIEMQDNDVGNESPSQYTEIQTSDREIQRMSIRTAVQSGKDSNDKKVLLLAQLKELIINIQTLDQEEGKLAGERKDFQEQTLKVEKSMLEKEVSFLKENCSELTKKLEELKAENDALRIDRKNLKKECEGFEEMNIILNKLFRNEIKSHEEQRESLTIKNTSLKSKSYMSVIENCRELMKKLEDIKAENDALHIERKNLKKKCENFEELNMTLSKLFKNEMKMHEQREAMSTENTLQKSKSHILIVENCKELMKKLEGIKTENDNLRIEKNNFKKTCEHFEALNMTLNKLHEKEIKSHKEQREALITENTLLQSKCHTLEVYLKDYIQV